ncbi:MAG: glycosyltransferase [bacterium]
MRVALVHDWLTGMRGGEKVLESLCELFPEADIFTLVHLPEKISPIINSHNIQTSFIQRLPGIRKFYQYYLPLFPLAAESFDLTEYDLVISSSHCAAKGVITRPGTCHISYLHAPMRYAWELFYQYFPASSTSRIKRFSAALVMNRLRIWDRVSADRVDYFIANSHHTRARIKKHYRREATVVHPPVDTDFFTLSAAKPRDFYLIVSALVPYKRIDIAIQACQRLDRRLIIVGRGPELKRLQAISGSRIEFTGWLNDEEILRLYHQARGFLFPGEEDFGITPLEALACGLPVIAYNRGGVTETVLPGKTGLLFERQTTACLVQAIKDFEELDFNKKTLRRQAGRFSKRQFADRLQQEIETLTELFKKEHAQTA